MNQIETITFGKVSIFLDTAIGYWKFYYDGRSQRTQTWFFVFNAALWGSALQSDAKRHS
jgi:hypothetical protein